MVNKTTITKNHGPSRYDNRRGAFFALVRVRFYFLFRVFLPLFSNSHNINTAGMFRTQKKKSKKDNASPRDTYYY